MQRFLLLAVAGTFVTTVNMVSAFTLNRNLLGYRSVVVGTIDRTTPTTQLYMATKRKKASMAEKKARRHSKKVASPTTQQDLPQCKLDFKTVPKAEEAPVATTAGPTTTTEGLDASKKITDPKVAETRAQQMIKAQRESVDMLTSVRERIEKALPDSSTIQSSLNSYGYLVFDGFLEDDKILAQLRQESGSNMLPHMEVDLTNIGSGEYITTVKGGEEQYGLCPRLVELVVSTTKHLPNQIQGGEGNENNEQFSLDSSACMATLRTFDRNAFKASLELLTGDNNDEDAILEDASKNKPFSVVATEPDDKRKISMLYYILPEAWNESCGGGISFASNSNSDGEASSSISSELVHAKSDRLILFNSDTTKYRREPWKGSDEGENSSNMIGSCVELHFVAKSE